MLFIYRVITLIIYYIFFPFIYIIFAKNNFKQRISFKKFPVDYSIWIHASSLGEVNAVRPFILELLEKHPSLPIIITSMTKTGIDAAKKISGKVIVNQFPLDLYPIMLRAFKEIKPKLILLMETELWPNMISIAYKKKIPIIILNARLSDRSFPRYKALRIFWKPLLKKISLVNAQSEKDKERYLYLGAQNVVNVNNLKFSIELPVLEKSDLRKAWKYQFNDFIIALGSSRPGEEKLLIEVIKKIETLIPRLKVIIVPRHLQRLSEIKNLFSEGEYSLFSENKNDHLFMIVDEMGVLPQVYAISDISIIGGSFYNFGGHNPLEAANYEVPILIGPYHHSCEDIVNKLLSNHGIEVCNHESLQNSILNLANNIEIRREMGKNAKNTILENMNSLELHYTNIKPWIERIK